MKMWSVTKIIGLSSVLGLATYGGISATKKAADDFNDSITRAGSGFAGVVVKEVGSIVAKEIGHQAAKALGEKIAEDMIMREFLPPELHNDFRKFKREKHEGVPHSDSCD